MFVVNKKSPTFLRDLIFNLFVYSFKYQNPLLPTEVKVKIKVCKKILSHDSFIFLILMPQIYIKILK